MDSKNKYPGWHYNNKNEVEINMEKFLKGSKAIEFANPIALSNPSSQKKLDIHITELNKSESLTNSGTNEESPREETTGDSKKLTEEEAIIQEMNKYEEGIKVAKTNKPSEVDNSNGCAQDIKLRVNNIFCQ